MIVLLLNVLAAFVLLFFLLSAKSADAKRGSNSVTRFVRDSVANARYSQVSLLAFVITAICFVLSLLTKYPVIGCLPTLAVLILCFKFKADSNKNAQRVKDARVVTKGALDTTAVAGEAAGTVAGGVIGAKVGNPRLGANVGKAVGSAAGSVAKSCSDNMADVPSLNIEKFRDPELFMQKAKALGMMQDGEDLSVVANRVISCASPVALESMPESLSIEDKAMYLLEGKV